MYKVLITGLEAYAYHGVSSEEQAIGHRYIIDAELDVNGRADQSDDVSDTVDYGTVAGVIQERLVGAQSRTLEYLSHAVAADILARFKMVEAVEITLAKPFPPMPFVAESAAVSIRVER